jgi:hypothetical protein
MNPNEVSQEILAAAKTQTGESLDQLSRQAPVLVVFLRHCGCTFAREAITDLAAQRLAIDAAGTIVVFVHMFDDAHGKALVEKRGFPDALRIHDPEQKLYQAFQLPRGSVWQLIGPGIWWRAIKAIFGGHGIGIPNGDVRQLPGVFLLHNGKIVKAFRGQSSADRPDYAEMAHCPIN